MIKKEKETRFFRREGKLCLLERKEVVILEFWGIMPTPFKDQCEDSS